MPRASVCLRVEVGRRDATQVFAGDVVMPRFGKD